MKKLAMVLVVIVGLSSYAQHNPQNNNFGIENQFTAEQQATLKSKKMALHLDLNSDQQNKVYNLILRQEQDFAKFKSKMKKDREDGKQPTSEEHFNRMNKNLDAKLAFQNELKSILTPSQFQVWKESAKKMAQSQFKNQRMNHQKGKFN